MTGREQRFHPDYSLAERLYIAALGMPIVGLRIRARNVLKLIPADLRPRRILDAGSGPGVITFALAREFPEAEVVGVDLGADTIRASRMVAERAGFERVRFEQGDLRELPWRGAFDLVVCVDILEHIEDDSSAIAGLLQVLQPGGMLLLHVPAYHRRYPVFGKRVNFHVPTHVRPGYEPGDIVSKVRGAGFHVAESGYTYGFLETLANNISYMITRANRQNREIYAMAFPWLNALGWLGRHARPKQIGAGVFVIARRPSGDREERSL